MAIMKWAIVQHSGYGYSEKSGFKQGLEQRVITTQAELKKVEKAGGIVFDTYGEADEFCMMAMYGEDNRSIIPKAKGTFSEQKIDGLRIYIPVREVKG